MFKIVNVKTGKDVKDAISCKVITFDTFQAAEMFANSLTRDSITGATAWNRVRPTKFVIKSAK